MIIPLDRRILFACCALLVVGCANLDSYPRRIAIHPTQGGEGPRILALIAHPDDESAFAGALYASAIEHGSVVDVICITNGEGGFKYSTLAQREHGLPLTQENVGRKHLPRIRERELTRALGWLGVRELLMLGEQDHRYTTDLDEVMIAENSPWNLELIRAHISDQLNARRYDIVLTLAPSSTTHAHHQAATLLVAQAIAAIPKDARPVLLVPTGRRAEDQPIPPEGLTNKHLTRVAAGPFSFNRRTRFGHRERLDYSIPILWAMAEHRSQGTLQMMVGRTDLEDYWVLAASAPGASQRARAWLELLSEPTFEVPAYGESAGTNARWTTNAPPPR